VDSAADLLREVRSRHALDQRTLARRARTSQTQISRIEREVVSPSVATLARLLTAMGERLELDSAAFEGNRSAGEVRADAELSMGERVTQAADVSHALTSIAGALQR